MKRILAILTLLFLLIIPQLKAQVSLVSGTWTASGNPACPNTSSTFTLPTASNFNFSQFTRGAGVTCNTATNGFNGSGFNSVDSLTAFNNAKYYEVVVTSTCPSFQLDSLRLFTQSSGTGPVLAYVLLRVNGGSFVPFGPRQSIPNNATPYNTLFTGPAINVPVGGTLTIRIYGYGASSSGGTFRVANGTATYFTATYPSATMSGGATLCTGGNTNLTVNFTGTSPWDIIYSDGFTPVAINAVASNPYIINVTPSGTRTFSISSVVSLCSGSVAGTAPITVEAQITNNNVSPSQSICLGGIPLVFNGSTPLGGSGSFTYVWESSSDNSTWSFLNFSNSANYQSIGVSSNTYFRRQVSGGVCPGSVSSSVSVQIFPVLGNIAIGSAQTICGGAAPAQLTGSLPTGGNGTYVYQWQSSLDQSTWGSITNATTQSYTPVILTNSQYFRRRVGSSGCSQQFGNDVFITVEPALGNNLVGASQQICAGTPANTLTGTIPTGGTGSYGYQWETSADQLTWNSLVSSTLQDQVLGTPLSTLYYRRVVTSGICPPQTTGSVAILVDQVINGNILLQNQTICSGTSAATLTGLLPAGGNGIFVYQWQQSPNNSTWTTLTGAVGQNYVPGSPSSNLYFRRIVTSGFCTPSTSPSVSIYVQSPVGNNLIGSSQTICNGATANPFTGSIPTGGDGIYTYQWQTCTDNLSWLNSGIVTQGFIPGSPTSNRYYRRVSSSGVCIPFTSVGVRIQVDVPSLNNLISGAQTLCATTTPAIISGTVPTGGTGIYNYGWASALDSVSWVLIPTQITPNYQSPGLSLNTYFRRIVVSGVCSADSGNIVSITFYPLPSPNMITSGQTLCGTAVPAALVGSSPTGGLGGITYEWLASADSINWSPIPSATSAGLNPGILSQDTYFTRVITSGNCPQDTAPSILIQLQSSLGDNQILSGQTICAGSNPGLITGSQPTGGNGLFTYQWESSPDNSTWSTLLNGNFASWQPQVSGSSHWYRRIVLTSVCAQDTSPSSRLTITPIPTAVLGNDQTICQGGISQISVNLTGGTPPWDFTYSDGVNQYQATNVNFSPYFINITANANTTYTLASVNDGCPGFYSGQAAIRVLTPPSVIISSNQSLCNNQSTVLTINYSGNPPWDVEYFDGFGNVIVNGINSTAYTFVVNPLVTTTYRLVSISDSTCTRNNLSNQIVVVALDATPPNISFNWVMNGNTVWFTNTTTNATSYLWNFGDNKTSQLASPYHYYFFGGNYNVMLIASNACASDTAFSVVTGVSSDRLRDDATLGLKVYPQPSAEEIHIDIPEGMDILSMKWIDIQGKEIETLSSIPQVGDRVWTLPASSSLTSGMYYLQCNTSEGLARVPVWRK